jgi:Na+-transporting methylmalonyl-CoA/oxaloacetate decarboxylase gamma subunit
MTDWSEALLIGGAGFATVLVVLFVLALVVWLVGAVVRRLHGRDGKHEG